MMSPRASLFLLVALAFVTPAAARADALDLTLNAGTKAEYRLDYRGDGSPITVAVDVSNPDGISMSVYTPAQVESMRRGDKPTPIGRGTPNRAHSLFWAGAFRVQGSYRVIVENKSTAPILYRIEIAGEGVSGAALVQPVQPETTSGITTQSGQKVLNVKLPPGAAAGGGNSASTLRLPMPPEPKTCLHANQIPPTIVSSVKLCPNEIYPPLRISGSNIGLYSDDKHTAIVTSAGRQFAITIDGSNNWIEGVVIQGRADDADLGAWLCLYDDCVFPTTPQTVLHGGTLYGGGILLQGSRSTIHGVTVRGGTIGVATVGGQSNYIVDNQLSDLNGWGSFNLRSVGSYFVGNVLNRVNHGCKTPDGRKFLNGCETSGWVCLGCSRNVIAQNHCELSANCFYMSGERGLASNDNRLVANFCAGATDNCFEITFARGNVLKDNVATADANTDRPCKYPFWIGGSTVYDQNNTWECSIDDDDALQQARSSTPQPTSLVRVSSTWTAGSRLPLGVARRSVSVIILGEASVEAGVTLPED